MANMAAIALICLLLALIALNVYALFSKREALSAYKRIAYAGALLLLAVFLLLEAAGFSMGLRQKFGFVAAVCGAGSAQTLLSAALALFFILALTEYLLHRKTPGHPRAIALIVLLAVALEGTLFNYKFYDSLGFKEITDFETSYSGAFVPADDLSYDLSAGGQAYRLDFSRGEAVVTLSDIGDTVENLYFDADNRMAAVTVSLSGSDEGTDEHKAFPEHKIVDTAETSRYIRLHMSGKTKKLTIRILPKSEFEDDILIRSIRLNKGCPFHVSFLRVILTAILLMLLFVLRPGSKAYETLLVPGDRRQRKIIALVTAVLLLLLCVPAKANQYADNAHRNQYEELAKAFEKGQLSFLYAPPEELIEMENPYDLSARRAITKEKGVYFHYDHAYYNGRYYMYFGVVPEILLFFPYRLITGRSLPTYLGTAILIALLCIGIMLLIYRVARGFQRPRLMTYILVSAAACIALGVIFTKYPSLYSIPIVSGAAFSAFGLYFWISAKDGGKLKPVRLALGSLCVALIFGCRPQMGLLFLLAVPIFWNETLKTRTLFSKKGLINTLALLLPFVPVALALMWYNAARFGSPFDFGANYNLTTNDMTLRGFVLARLPAGLYSLFLQLPAYTLTFPFLETLAMQTGYQGTTISEAMFGGVYAAYPLLLLAPAMFFCRDALKKSQRYGLSLMLLFLPLVIASADIEMAGVLNRYTGDFMLMLFLAAAITAFTIEDNETGRALKIFHGLLSAAFVCGLVYAFCFLFAQDENCLSYEFSAPRLYDTVSQFLMFFR